MVMKGLRLLTAVVLVPVVLAGCATTDDGDKEMMGGKVFKDEQWCMAAGAVATGGLAAGLASGGSAAGAAGAGVMGALAGGVMSQYFCMSDGEMMKDSDGDGVPDDKDNCPGTPPGVSVDADGCPKYSDADDVPDYLDQCPGTPAGVAVDEKGCPLDSDGDGVADYLDKCQDTPKGAKVDSSGCPQIGEAMAIVTNINFDFDSSELRQDAKDKLARVLDILKKNQSVNVTVIGHTDSTGPEGYNQSLSLRRAQSVADYLGDNGVSVGRLTIDGKGESQPLVSNNTRAGRAVNRRVEFQVRN
jgi:OOP family OmpA-OmpF porin